MGNENRTAGMETILIVDDVETNRLVLEEIIKDMGCRRFLRKAEKRRLLWPKNICLS